MKTLFFAAALAGTTLGGAAFAAQATPDQTAPGTHGGHGRAMGRGMMMHADSNGDGTISRAEFMAQAEAHFARMDKNGDGVIAADEMRGGAAHGPGGGMMAADTDHDGKITRAEFMAQASAHFARLDTNGDGQISGDEMKAMMERMHEGGGMMGGRHGPGAMMPPPPPGAEGGPMGGHHGHHGAGMMERLDTNHDGRISRDEMRASVDRRFDKLDTNHDGFVDKAEMEAAHAKMKDRMGKMRMRRGMPSGDTPPPPPPGK